jgi:hypothetical protein
MPESKDIKCFKDTEESYLKVFINFQITSQRCKTELIKEIIKLGELLLKTTTKRYFYTIWFNLKNMFIYKDLMTSYIPVKEMKLL